jgi:hypothetical protein
MWKPDGDDGTLFRIVIPVNSNVGEIKLSLSQGEEAEYHRMFIYTDSTTSLLSIQFPDLEVRTFLQPVAFVGGTMLYRIVAGMSGSLTYQSIRSQKVCRIDIVCDANARARLQNNDEFEWADEDLGHLQYHRGIKIIPEPEFITEYTFDFHGGKHDENNTWIGDGFIASVHFYAEVSRFTEYDSPIMVTFAVEPIQNEQSGIFYYIDEAGRTHCVTINEVRFTLNAYTHLWHDPKIQTVINLETEQRRLSRTIHGSLNLDCLPSIGDIPEPPKPPGPPPVGWYGVWYPAATGEFLPFDISFLDLAATAEIQGGRRNLTIFMEPNEQDWDAILPYPPTTDFSRWDDYGYQVFFLTRNWGDFQAWDLTGTFNQSSFFTPISIAVDDRTYTGGISGTLGGITPFLIKYL